MAKALPRKKELELIRLARGGNERAKNQLIRQLEFLAYSFIPEHLRFDKDARADALLKTWGLILVFDESKNTRISTFMGESIKNYFLTQNYLNNMQKRTGIEVSLSAYDGSTGSDKTFLEEINGKYSVKDLHVSYVSTDDMVEKESELENIYRLVERSLDHKEKSVFKLALSGKENKEIGQILGITNENVGSVLYNAKRRMAKAYRNDTIFDCSSQSQ